MENAGVADDRVEAAVLIKCGLHDCLAALRGVDRLVGRHRGATGGADLVDHLVGDPGIGSVTVHRRPEVVDDHRCTSAGEVEGVQASESSAGSGHDDHLSVEIDHDLSLRGLLRCLASVR